MEASSSACRCPPPPPGSASGPVLAAITDGFVLRDDFSMLEVKTLASTLEGYKVKGVHWRYILNNTTSTRGKASGGNTILPLATLLVSRQVGDLQEDSAPLIAPGSARAHEAAGILNGCPANWWCAILPLPNSFTWTTSSS